MSAQHDRELDALQNRSRPGAIGERYDRRPDVAPPILGHMASREMHLGAVTAVHTGEGFFVNWVTVNPCANEADIRNDPSTAPQWDTSTTLWIKCMQDTDRLEWALPLVGYAEIVANDEIGFFYARQLGEQVQDSDPAVYFDGWMAPWAGPQGGRLLYDLDLMAGPGIEITAPEPVESHPVKVSVDLSEVPGLEFDEEGDNGELKVKPDTAKGIDVGALGVCVDLAEASPGLYFPGGDLAVLANPAKAVVVEAAGVGVVPDPGKSVSVSADGVAVDIAATTPGLKRDGVGDLAFYPKTLGGLAVAADGVSVKATLKSVYVDPVSGDVRVFTDGTSGIGIDEAVKGVYIVLDDGTDNLEFTVGGELRHSQNGPLQAGNPVEKMQLRCNEGVLESRIYVNGGWQSWITGAQVDFDGAGHVTGTAPD